MGYRDNVPELDRAELLPAWEAPRERNQVHARASGFAITAAGARAAEHAFAPTPGSPQHASARPRRRRFAWLIGLTLTVVGTSGWYVGSGANAPEKFLTATVEVGAIEDNVSATGTVQPLQFVDVGTQVTGQLRALHVEVGDVVQKGQLIAEIDPSLFQFKVDTTRAALQTLEAQLLDRQSQAQLGDLLLARNRQLKSADAVSEEVLQQSEAAAVQARAQVNAVVAQVKQARASLAGDEANLRYTRIYAPMAGTIVALNARQGQTLVSSQQAPVILRIADLRTMTVWAQVSEADVPRIAVGMPVYFNTLGLPKRRWESNVRQVLPTPDAVNNVVLYNVLFDVANADAALKPQMSTQVFFRLAGADNALTIPEAALQSAAKPRKAKDRNSSEPRGEDKAYIVRVLRQGQVEERPIVVGLQTRMQAQVLSGLAEGEEVIVGSASNKAKSGQGKTSTGATRAL
jgi:membrane fusion protein, macrolide-specific efflux system